MLATLLPAAVRTAEAFSDIPGEPVFPGEEDLVANVVDLRRREFVTARRCAREALRRLGVAPAPIRIGAERAPVWLTGVVGSITHCTGYRAAAVARSADLMSVGIDAEPHQTLPAGTQDYIVAPGEADMLRDLRSAHPRTHWDRLLFSAKEAVYKAWFPLTGRWLGLPDARLTIDPTAGRFSAQLLVDGPRSRFSGRFLATDRLILTAVAVGSGD
ncbi:4'-phosphopantetheinyl transferase superfamily protein [Micromonospora sp. WMMA1998]|uniref:4'-phosphopantetheinyl transferase family protein n=1 Tax=Micromonospora sp. WMMA1998 TaxID=3015167 RepID=UPI00248AE0BA|nr:4'-phosphopantetheinyl transferase superfamily protein [Micromonospora sp. WMMA1998]WBC16768.1 4'-phosphopantetheinyl transferase superfamily protein [Micromonospora sp. WMMA1998]